MGCLLPCVVAEAEGAVMAAALNATSAAVLPVGEEVDAFAGAAGVPILASLVAVAAVLAAVLGVHTHALAARRAGASGLQAHGRGLLDAVVVRRRRRELVGQEAASPGWRHRCSGGGEEGERHEKDGGFSHGGRRWWRFFSARRQCVLIVARILPIEREEMG